MINKKLIDKDFFDVVVSFYETHIAEDTCKEFDLTKKQFYKLLSNFNYKKPKELQIRTTTSSHENYLIEHGFVEVYDCGQATYARTKER